MIISYPNEEWIKNKIGETGLGIPGKEYMARINCKAYGMSGLPILMSVYKSMNPETMSYERGREEK